jgi:hypothetical protein
VVTADEEDDGAVVVDPREPSGRPGTRAPHIPIGLDGSPASSLDLVGPGLVLLAGPGGQPWLDAAAGMATSGVPLSAHLVGQEGRAIDLDGRFASAFGTGSEGATVLRPDGVIGWRTDRPADDPAVVLDDVVHRLLCR